MFSQLFYSLLQMFTLTVIYMFCFFSVCFCSVFLYFAIFSTFRYVSRYGMRYFILITVIMTCAFSQVHSDWLICYFLFKEYKKL